MRYFLFALSVAFSLHVSSQNWEIQEGYKVEFSGKKAEGSFGGLDGKIYFDPYNFTSAKFDVSLDVGTIETGNKTKNKHAKGENWLDAITYPKVRFVSKTVTKTVNGYLAVGQLTLRGIEQEVQLPFTFSDRGESALFTGTLEVNRKDFNIIGNFMEWMVGDEFVIEIEVPVTRSEG